MRERVVDAIRADFFAAVAAAAAAAADAVVIVAFDVRGAVASAAPIAARLRAGTSTFDCADDATAARFLVDDFFLVLVERCVDVGVALVCSLVVVGGLTRFDVDDEDNSDEFDA